MSREFNGSSDYVRSSTVAITSFPFTVLAWVNPDINNAEQYAFYAGNGSSTTDYVVLGINASGKVRAAVRDAGADNNKASTGTVPTGEWSLIAGEFDGSGTTLSSVTVVLNTTRESPLTTSDAGLLASYTRTSLGRRDRSGADAYFNGHLAYVTVVSGIPTAQNYTDLQTKAPHLVFPSSRIHYYRLTAGDATDWEDEAGSADFTTISGTTATNGAGDNPTLTITDLVKYLKLLAHSSAAGDTGVEGVVLNSTRDTVIGEFSGQAFEADLESGEAVLLIPAEDITPDGSTLTTNDTPLVAAYNSTDGTVGLGSATVIEV